MVRHRLAGPLFWQPAGKKLTAAGWFVEEEKYVKKSLAGLPQG